MSNTNLAALVYHQDAACTSPQSLFYTNQKGSGCSIGDTVTCTPVSAYPGWYVTATCVPANQLATNTNTWPNDAQFQNLVKASACSGDATGGTQFPLGRCVPLAKGMLPSPTGDGTFALSMKATIDPLSPNLNYFWSLYTDSACTTFLIDQSGNLLSNGKGLNPDTLGVNNAPGCYANHQETVLNYDKSKQSLLTAYTGSDCKTAAKVTVNPTYSNNCTDAPTCTRDPTTGEYYTRSCSSSASTDLTTRTQSLFPDATKYITLKQFSDNQCFIPLTSQTILLDTCFPGGGIGNSVKATISDAGIKVSTFKGTLGCVGTSTDLLLPIDQSCTVGVGMSVLAVTKNQLATAVITGTAPSPTPVAKSDNGGSSVPVGAIVGGVVGGLVVLCAIGFAVWYSQRKKRAVADSGKSESEASESVRGSSRFRYAGSSILTGATSRPATRQEYHAPTAQEQTQPSGYAQSTAINSQQSHLGTAHVSLATRDEKQTSRLFTDMTEVASNIGDARSSKYLQTATQGHNSYTMFGDLYLPDTPSVWTVNQVVQWVQRNEGTPEILSFIQEQEIDGRALLLIREDDLAFPTVGRRMRFREALDALRRINEARVHAAAPLPSYSG